MHPRKPDPEKYCQACGTRLARKRMPSGILEDYGVFLRRKYCTMICAGVGARSQMPTLAALRYRAKQHRGTTCAHCGTRDKLQTHHQDSNPANNDPGNLMTLCSTCHMRWHWAHGKTQTRKATNCSVCGVAGKMKLGMCQKHYQRWKRYGDARLTKRRTSAGFVLMEAP